MKILFVDTFLGGHHVTYINSVMEPFSGAVACIPAPCDSVVCSKKIVTTINKKKKYWYFVWIKRLKKIIGEEKPDIVHFVYGDALYRFWGIHFPKDVKIVITCHQIRRSFLRDMAYRVIARKVDAIVVHTDKLKSDFEGIGVKNVYHNEYPHFSQILVNTDSKTELGLARETKVILALGATTKYKGLDILLAALNKVNKPFVLLIAGAKDEFDEKYIAEHSAQYAGSVKTILRYLDENEFSMCLNAADIVCLPYRKSFDGASGPLGEGVAIGKMIVGPNHGSLGSIIENNHLGLTFEAENETSLAEALEKALAIDWKPDSKYLAYKELMSPKRFQIEYSELFHRIAEQKSLSR